MKNNTIHKYISNLENKILNPKKGLGEEIFLFISRIIPLINVDLLIKDKRLGILLTWRKKSENYPAGWHVPGGMIRVNEKIYNRVIKVAKNELGIKIIFKNKPLAVNEIHLKQKNRSHCISLLYLCKPINKPDIRKKFKGLLPLAGQWKWFKKAPKNLIKPHKIYKKFLNSN